MMSKDQMAPLRALFLLLLLPTYIGAYLLHPAVPDSSSLSASGWWNWFDQGQYLRAAWALNLGNLEPQNYFYPPLYSVLGAVFLRFSPAHPFFVIDIICFLLFSLLFLELARRYVGTIAAIALFCVSFLHPLDIGATWIEPWTSTLVAPVLAYLFWQLDRLQTKGFATDSATLARAGFAGGIAFATRPVDAAIMVPIFLFVAAKAFQHCSTEQHRAFSAALLKQWSSLAVPGVIGIAFFCGFNWIVHGSLGGSYFQVSTSSNGFHLGDLAEKAVAIFLDPKPLYGAGAEAILHRAPQLALVLPGLVFSCLYGPMILRLILLTAAVQFCIYLPYADLLPTGTWKYHNIHYFKWMLPYFWLCGGYPFYQCWCQYQDRRRIIQRYAVCAVAAVLLLCARFTLIDLTGDTRIVRIDEASPTSALHWHVDNAIDVDMIFLPTLQGDFDRVYFSHDLEVHVNGKLLRSVRDYRLIPTEAEASGVNLLFIRPVQARDIHINPGQLTLLPGPLEARTFSYRFRLGYPAWLQR